MSRRMGEPNPTRRAARSQAAIRQLQRRPAPDPAAAGGASGSWATAYGFQTMVDAGSFLVCWFNYMSTNDTATFEPAGVVSSRAQWLQVNDPGFYEMQCYVTGIGARAQDLYIDPAFSLGGSPAAIGNNLDERDFVGNRYARSAYQLTADVATLGIFGQTAFLWDPAIGVSDMDNENPLKLGLTVAWAGSPATVTADVGIYVKKIAGAGYTALTI